MAGSNDDCACAEARRHSAYNDSAWLFLFLVLSDRSFSMQPDPSWGKAAAR